MLFHSLLEVGSTMYLDQAKLLLEGVADPAALSQPWQQVIDRTPILRASVTWEDAGEPVQVLADDRAAGIYDPHLFTSATIGHLTDRLHVLLTAIAANPNQVLFHRWSGQDDIAVGAAVVRQRTFREFLTAVRETALDAFAHQNVPFELVADELQLPCDTNGEATVAALELKPEPELSPN